MLSILQVSVLLVAHLAHARAGYERIDNYLTNKVNTDAVEPNLEAANRWLGEASCTQLSFLCSTPISDLRKFIALQEVADDTRCDGSTYEVMRKNERAIGLSSLVAEGKAIRRVDKVMLEIFKEHAERCDLVYISTFRKKAPFLGEIMTDRVKAITKRIMHKEKSTKPEGYDFYSAENLFNNYVKQEFSIDRCLGEQMLLRTYKNHGQQCIKVLPINLRGRQIDCKIEAGVVELVQRLLRKDGFTIPDRIFHQSEAVFDEYIKNSISVSRFLAGSNVLRDALIINAKEDSNFKYLQRAPGSEHVHKDKIKDLVDQYLIEPCRRYMDNLGPAVFTPARIDALFEVYFDQYNPEFYLSWASFMICKALVENEGIVVTDVTLAIASGA